MKMEDDLDLLLKSQKGRVPKFCISIRISFPKKIRGPPLPPALLHIWGDKGVKFKICRTVSKFCMGS